MEFKTGDDIEYMCYLEESELDEVNINEHSFEVIEENVIQSDTEIFLYHSSLEVLAALCAACKELIKLTIIKLPGLKTLSNMNYLFNLKELWVVECNIKDVTALENCTRVEKLYLYSNQIEKIPNLSKSSKHLHTLWLSGNRLSEIKNLQCLEALQELYLANNNLTQIGDSLQHNQQLCTLNISGNPLTSFKDTLHLKKNIKLLSLSFADPVYGFCPLARLCNYRSFIIYHLQPKNLDTYKVTLEEMNAAKEFYSNKLMYYNAMYQANLTKHQKQLKTKEEEHNKMLRKFRKCLFKYKIQSLETEDIKTNKKEKQQEIKTKTENAFVRLKYWNEHIKEWALLHEEKRKVRELHLNCELQNSGNITFIYSSDDKKLFQSCQELMDSFLCPYLQRTFEIKSVFVSEATAVVNKRVTLMHESTKGDTSTSKSVFLLLAKIYDVKNWPLDLVENGFINVKENSLIFTNCLYLADTVWLRENKNQKSLKSSGNQRKRLCILVKILLDILSVSPSEIEHTHTSCTVSLNAKEENVQCCNLYKVTNPNAVLPVFVIEYEYEETMNSLEIFKQNIIRACDIHSSDMNSALPRYKELNEPLLQQLLPNNSKCSLLTELNLVGCGIKSFEDLPKLPNVQNLSVSYNYLKAIPDPTIFPMLQILDVSFNSISSLDHVKKHSNLEELNISWNFLRDFITFNCLKNKCAKLKILDISHNPLNVTNMDDMAQIVNNHFPHVKVLNGEDINTMMHINKVVDLRRQCQSTNSECLFANINNSILSLKWKAEMFSESITKTELKTMDTSSIEMPLRWIYLKQTKAATVQNTYILDNILWADFSYNLLQDVSFLSSACILEELSLSHNVIQELGTWLPSIKLIVKLDLSNNYITDLKEFGKASFPNLKILNVSRNAIESLIGLEQCIALTEFYAAQNLLKCYDDLFALKDSILLQIIDVSLNPFDNKKLREFIVFHFQRTEVVNGLRVQESDIYKAQLTYGGCLNTDFILERSKHVNLQQMMELTLLQCDIRKIDLPEGVLPKLESLDLQKNYLNSLWGLHLLPSLKTLCLSHNHVTKLGEPEEMESVASTNIFPNLEVLYLNNNNITTLTTVNLHLFPKLNAVFLQCNELVDLKGLQRAIQLQSVVLDRNKIEFTEPEDFDGMNNLQEMYLEGNKIHHLNFAINIKKLQRFFLSHNKIEDPEEIKHLTSLEQLKELTLLGNPVCRTTNHYLLILQYLPSVVLLDGHNIEIKN